MSATPIPRTLALVLYGDLDISRIDEMPKGRKRVATYVVNESYRARLYAFIRKQVAEGGQVYVVCPAIEEKEEEEAISFDLLGRKSTPPLKTAKEVCAAIREALPELSVDFLHGKMRSADKEAAMRRFVDGETHVLVSTTVIEVGVNVPRASLMIVENAERFGLSQLHQLRGRVGRGTKESFCVLVSDSDGTEAKARLETMRTTYDGYLVAEQDLKQRGPGDFLAASGTDAVRQSGGLSFRFASLCEDTDLLSAAAEEAKAIVSLAESEATAFWEENTLLKDETRRVFNVNAPLLS
jgi:ATP-dependent DNA helicase RecG